MATATVPTTTWSVGELASATGLSVRVLRHWEHVGLVRPSRTPSGHRRYGPVEITRLYRAMALRRTGLSLRRVAGLLEQQDPDPGDPSSTEADPALLMRVIETMTMFDQYIHGYQPDENLRLHDQAGALVNLLHDGISYPGGGAVLEVGCGVGAQTLVLAQRHPAAQITALDVSPSSLSEARRRTTAAGAANVTFVAGDVYDLPHADGPLAAASFDHVFVCFLLEHLPEPADALRRIAEMIRPGGTLTVIEGDHGSTYFHPDSAAAREVVAAQVTLQRHAGGDALIGRRLYPLLVEAGYQHVHVEPRAVYVDASTPELVDGFIRKTFTAMIAGIREPAVAAGLLSRDRFDAGVDDLERTTEPDGVFCYTFFRATAVRGHHRG